MDTNSVTVPEEITPTQRRQLFEELIGADRKTNPGPWWTLDQLINAAQDERDTHNDDEVAALCRHFPALEAVMMSIWDHHIRAGGCGHKAWPPCRICEPEAEVTA